MKFFSLLKKELREMLTAQLIVGVVIALFAFKLMGNVMGNVIEDSIKKSSSITICNRDDGQFINDIFTEMKKNNVDIKFIDIDGDDYSDTFKNNDVQSFIIIPEGFSDNVKNGIQSDVKIVSEMKSLSTFDNIATTISSQYVDTLKEAISTVLLSQNYSTDEIDAIKDPIKADNITVIKDKSADISPDDVMGFVSQQTTFIPVIIFILLMFASQMIITAISTEKIDKTLETLLSAPVSRGAVLASKMVSAGLIAAVLALVYMLGFNSFMGSLTDGILSQDGISNAINALGLKLGTTQFVMFGIQIFLTIMIALCISLVLGALAKDAKSAQALTMPIMLLSIVPYILSMFTDINTLPTVLRIILYIIPFTHTFTAIPNVLLGKTALFWAGAGYQLIFLAICMFFAVRVFMTDKIFTISLNLGQKAKMKKSFLLKK